MTAHADLAGSAKVVSLMANPSLWAGGFVVFLALYFEPSNLGRLGAASVGFASLSAVPIALLFVFKRAGLLSDIEMTKRPERGIVYGAAIGSYTIGALLLFLADAPWPVWGIVAVHVPASLILAVLNRWWKVSIHSAGLAGILAAALMLFGAAAWPLAFVVVIGAWARWAAGAHTVAELAMGAIVGATLTATGLHAAYLLASV